MTGSVNLRPIPRQDRDQLAAMLTPYFAEIVLTIEPSPVLNIDRNWNEKGRYPFWIQLADTPIGFALTHAHPNGQVELAEFAIVPDQRRKGWGRTAAHQLFAQCPGRWTLGVSAQPPQAAAFWQTCLTDCPTAHRVERKPPKTPHQIHSYNFFIAGPDND